MFRAALQRAIERKSMVRIHRAELVGFTIHGYVLAASDALVVMQPVRDRLDLDGYDVLRVVDITKIARLTPGRTEFYTRAWR